MTARMTPGGGYVANTTTSRILPNGGYLRAAGSTVYNKSVAGVLTIAGALSSSFLLSKTVVGSLLLASALTDTVTYTRAYGSTIAVVGGFAKTMYVSLSSTLVLSGYIIKNTIKSVFSSTITLASSLDEYFFSPGVQGVLSRGLRSLRKFIGRR